MSDDESSSEEESSEYKEEIFIIRRGSPVVEIEIYGTTLADPTPYFSEKGFGWMIRQAVKATPCLVCKGDKPYFVSKFCTVCPLTDAMRTLLHIARIHKCPKDIRKLLLQYLYRSISPFGHIWRYKHCRCCDCLDHRMLFQHREFPQEDIH